MAMYCSQCGTALEPGLWQCATCGAVVPQDVTVVSTPTHIGEIAVMWLLTIGYFQGMATHENLFATLCGVPSFIMAIYLVTQRNATDRTNGLARLGISLIVAVSVFVQLSGRV